MKIPKIIHYCWFGKGEMSSLEKRCIASWKKYCPDFQIKLWNEVNFDVNYCEFTKEAYKLGKYAFVSDVARLYALQQVGGIYLDTDMLLLKPIPLHFLKQKLFIGAENKKSLNAAALGAEKGNGLINKSLCFYSSQEFDSRPPLITHVLSEIIIDIQFPITKNQKNEWGLVLNPDVFYPLPFKNKVLSFNKFVTEETVGVHLWNASWKSDGSKNKFFKWIKYQLSKIYLPNSPQWYKEKFR
ncbi:glycosyltransferase [Belliella marina]|uniref:Glycosyltransferase n=1 Tax=Belliella marina TaxID=1644146 RepID=A0ABW4VQB3_9BACT